MGNPFGTGTLDRCDNCEQHLKKPKVVIKHPWRALGQFYFMAMYSERVHPHFSSQVCTNHKSANPVAISSKIALPVVVTCKFIVM